MGRPIDWSKAGTRIRRQPKRPDGTNPDWDWQHSRWKDEADYYAEELIGWEVVAMVPCPLSSCQGHEIAGRKCSDAYGATMNDPHNQRRRAAGVARLKEAGPRFGGEIVDV